MTGNTVSMAAQAGASVGNSSKEASAVLVRVKVAVAVFVFGAYVQTIIRSNTGDILVPYALSMAAGAYLLLTLRSRIPVQAIETFAAMIAVLGSQAVLVGLVGGSTAEQIRGSIQLLLSILASTGLYLGLMTAGRRFSARLGGSMATILFLGASLEILSPRFRALSDGIRGILYQPYRLYAADLRDLSLYGAVRPRFLANEPSYLALFFVLGLYLWYVTSDARRIRVEFIYLASAVLGLFVIRSPVVLLTVPLAAATWLLLFRRTRNRSGILGMFAAATTLYIFAFVVVRSLSQSGAAAGSSINTRVLAPFFTSLTAIRVSPVWGIGLGVETNTEELVRAGYRAADVDLDGLMARWGTQFETAAPFLTNNVYWHWIFFGLIWGLIMLVLYYRYWSGLGMAEPAFVAASVFMLWHGFGGYVDIRSVMVVTFAVAASNLLVSKSNSAFGLSDWAMAARIRR